LVDVIRNLLAASAPPLIANTSASVAMTFAYDNRLRSTENIHTPPNGIETTKSRRGHQPGDGPKTGTS
jgi:hypothetical protein